MMPAHVHQWKVARYTLLSLPSDGCAERYIEWRCQTCPQYCTITRDIHLGQPLRTPEFWTRLLEHEQAQGTPVARMAAQQQRGDR